jgi:hypothetical protein
MQNKEEWMLLAEQAAVEQDPVKMLKLITEINRILLEKEQRLVALRSDHPSSDKS